MMRRRLLLRMVLAIAALDRAASAQEPAPPPAEAIRQLEELETRWGRAFVEHDSAALALMIADEFEGIYPTRRLSKRDMLVSAALIPPPGARRLVASEGDETKRVRVFGESAVVTGSAVQRFEENGTSSFMRTVYTEVFVWRDGRWQCVAGHYTPLMTPN